MAATMVAPRKLNPQAPEFFPNYQIPRLLYPPFIQSPSTCIYYPPSVNASPFTPKEPVLVSPNFNHLLPSVTDRSQLVYEPPVVSPRDEKRGGCHRNRRRFVGKRRERDYEELPREKGKGFGNRRKGSSRPKHPVVPVRPEGQNTTVMIRNIPNRYTRDLLMEFLDNHCMQENEKAKRLQISEFKNETDVSAFDFLYLPIDFENNANKGYAFVNFTNPKAVWKFHRAVHNRSWGLFQSNKICHVAYARLQGKEDLERHFRSTGFECESDDYLPVSFSPPRDGAKLHGKIRIIGRRIGMPSPNHSIKKSL